MIGEVGFRVRAIVADRFGLDPVRVVANAHIQDDLGADSLDVVELVIALEDAFDIEVPDEDLEGMRTIGDVERYVAAHAA